MTNRKNALCAIVIGALAGFSGSAWASEQATATISGTPIAGGFNYNVSLTNTSTDGSQIGTFWFSWIPGFDFMEAKPTSITSPAGWNFTITGSNNSSDGNAILWQGGPALTQGNTDHFSFDSTETLAQLEGPSSYFSAYPETTAFIYSGGPFSDGGEKIVATAVVPEPVSAGIIALCSGGLLLRRRRTA